MSKITYVLLAPNGQPLNRFPYRSEVESVPTKGDLVEVLKDGELYEVVRVKHQYINFHTSETNQLYQTTIYLIPYEEHEYALR
jgi:hypothetical protein